MTSILVGARAPEDHRGRPTPRRSGARGTLARARSGARVKIRRPQRPRCPLPTSRSLDGSDAMHQKRPDYSAAYVVLHTDSGASGHGLTFPATAAGPRCVAALRALRATRCRPRPTTASPATCAASGARSHRTTSSAGAVRKRASSISLLERLSARRVGSLGQDGQDPTLEAPDTATARGPRGSDRLSAISRTPCRPMKRSTFCALPRRARRSARRRSSGLRLPRPTPNVPPVGSVTADEKVKELRRGRDR